MSSRSKSHRFAHRFAHAPSFVYQSGRVKVQCTCGAQSRKLDSEAEATEAYEAHMALVGIAEKQRMK